MQDGDIDISVWVFHGPVIPPERLKKGDIKPGSVRKDKKGNVISFEASQNPCLDHLLAKGLIHEDQHYCGVELSTLAMIARAYQGFRASRPEPEFFDRTGYCPSDMPGMADRFHAIVRDLGCHWRTLEDICIENRLRVTAPAIADAFRALEGHFKVRK